MTTDSRVRTATTAHDPRPPSRLGPTPPPRPHRPRRRGDHGEQVSVSGIARAAGVDRTFLYRHRELLEQIHAAAAQPRPPPPAVGRRSPAPPCRPTCSPPSSAAPAWPPAPTTSRPACPPCSASTPGASPGSAPPTTSTSSTADRLPRTARRRPVSSPENATKTSPPHAPPTANSWPESTPAIPQQVTSATPLAPHLLHTIRSLHQPLSCANGVKPTSTAGLTPRE